MPGHVRGLLAAILVAACLAWPAVGAAAVAHPDLSYDIDSPAGDPNLNALDLYTPDGAQAGDRRAVVVYVHGGGWRNGDKSNQIADKRELFTGAGYLFASVNYRLSPEDVTALDPARIRFPDHPHDLGEAIGWLSAHVADYGGDPARILLIGHSAGAHLVDLVSTDPAYVEAYGVRPWQLIGTVSLDTDALDVAARIADGSAPTRALFYNAFGTEAENAADGSWRQASPLSWAGGDDPGFLLVTQARSADRLADNRAFATALGEDPGAVFAAPYDHRGINRAVGSGADPAGETKAIMAFFADRVASAGTPPAPRLRKHPRKRLRTRHRRVTAKFRFNATGAARFECRLGRRPFRRCSSPRVVRVGKGRHRFRVRALSASDRPGPATSFRFRVIRRR